MVPDWGPLNGCVCVYVVACTYNIDVAGVLFSKNATGLSSFSGVARGPRGSSHRLKTPGLIDDGAWHVVQRITRDRNNAGCWLDYGTFCLYTNDLAKVDGWLLY